MFENATRKRCVALGRAHGSSELLRRRMLWASDAVVFIELGAATYSLPELRTGTKLHLPNRAVPTIITTARHGQAKGALNCRLERWRTRTSLPNWPGRNEPSAGRFRRLSVIRRESGLERFPKLPELRARKVRGSGLFGDH